MSPSVIKKIALFLICLFLYSVNIQSKEKIIIGVHGLGNKVSKDLYTKYWEQSITEGIKLISPDFSESFNLELCYWADFFYPEPLIEDSSIISDIINKNFSRVDSKIINDNIYDFQPYLPAVNPKREKVKPLKAEIKKYTLQRFKGLLTSIKIPVPGTITNLVIDNTLKELGFYFENKFVVVNHKNEKELIREAIQNDLIEIIKKHGNKDIMLIGHSMGTIIAYDALIKLSRTDPDIKISYFVTIGSPLGIPPVRDQIKSIYGYKVLKVPENIKNEWYNFTDLRDNVAFDPALEDYFKENSKKLTIIDDLVINDYIAPGGKPNYHKEYGYLRCERMSNLIMYFLCE